MRKSIILIPALLLVGLVWGQTPDAPGIHEYVYVDQEPEPLNLDEVVQKIGYPYKAIKDGIEGKVYCRILIDEQGHYQQHEITKKSHPLLNEAVNAQMRFLQFSPAVRNERPIKYWVNIPFSFNKDNSKNYYQKSPFLDQFGTRLTTNQNKAESLLNEALDLMDAGDYEQAELYLSRSISKNPNRSKNQKHSQDFLLIAYFSRGKSRLALHKPKEALADFIESIGIFWTIQQPSETVLALKADLYLSRARARLQLGQVHQSMQDCDWAARHCQLQESESVRYHLLRGKAFHLTKQTELAFQEIESAIDLQPFEGEAYYLKGIIMFELGAKEAARECLERAANLGISDWRTQKLFSLLEPK